MSNQLIKDTHVTYTPGSPGVPATSGQLAQAAYTSWSPQVVCAYQPTDPSVGGSFQYLQDPVTHEWIYTFVPAATPPPGGYVSSGYAYLCNLVQVPTYHSAMPYIAPTPGVPGTPEQTNYDFNLGWNAGARSNGFIYSGDDGYVEWKVPYSLVGGVLGFNDVDVDASYPNIEHAFYFSGKSVRIYELGVQVAFIGAYADGDTFRITRVAGVVTYQQNGSTVYTSLVASTGTVFLDSSLYAGGDYVFDPVIATTGTPTVANQSVTSCATSLQPLTGQGGSMLTSLVSWPPGVYPVTASGNVSGVVTGSLVGGVLVSGSFGGSIVDSSGALIGDVQAPTAGTDLGTGFDGTFSGVILDHTTGAVIGYVSGTLAGSGSGTGSYAAAVSGDATYVLIPVGAIGTTTGTVSSGTIAGTVGADGAFTGTYTGTVTNPVNGNVIGTFVGTVTGTVNPDGSITGTYTGVVIDPATGAVVGVVIGAIGGGSGTGVLTPNGDGSSSYTTGTVTGGSTFIPEAPPETIIVSTYGSGMGALQPLTGSGGYLPPPPAYALAAGALAPLIGAGISLTGEIGGGATSMLPLVGGISSDHAYAESRGVMQPLIGFGSALEGNGNASMGEFITASTQVRPTVELVVLMDEQGQLTHVMAVQMVVSDTPPAVIPPGSIEPPPFQIGSGAALAMHDVMSTQRVLYALLPESALFNAYTPAGGSIVSPPMTVTGPVTGTGTGTGTVAVTGTMTGIGTTIGSGTLTGTLTLTTGTVTGAITGTVTGTVGAGGVFTGTFVGTGADGNRITGTVTGIISNSTLVVPPLDSGNSAWVLNWDSSASVRYENYDFTSFAKIGDRYYGVKPDGIYLLEGDDDDGVNIRASASFGKLDFGTPNKKRVPHAYIGVSSGGTMYLRVTANGQTFTYAARRADSDMRTQRVDLGKGLMASYMEFELYNHDGCDFELNSVDFAFVELTRRI